MSDQENPLLEFVDRYGPHQGEEGPVRFVTEVLGITLDPWQERVLRAFGRGERQIAVRSCHGPGKTATAAWCCVYMLCCVFPQRTVVTAPTSGQLKGALVPEVKKWLKRVPAPLLDNYNIKAEGIYFIPAPEESYFESRTSRAETPEALQGVHSEHVLLVGDEASGIPEQVFQAASGSMSDEHATTLLIGNPVRTSGLFFEAFHSLRHRWYTEHVSYKDSSRVSDKFVRDMAETYGADSSAYRVRVLGEFPLRDEDSVIPFELVESARTREIEEAPDSRKVWGLDVARFGNDRSALVERTRRSARVLDVWGHVSLMETVGRVKARWDDLPPHDRPSTILVDVIGMGGGVVDRLHEMGLPVHGVNVGESASMSEKYMRARSELWWKCREWLEKKDVHLEPGKDDKDDPNRLLAVELTTPTYNFTSSGKIQVEPKSEVKKRTKGNKSPDIADALVITFAEDLSMATFGSANSSSWNEPIKRGFNIP